MLYLLQSMTTKFAISPDQTRIAYDITGAGPAILLVHGGGGSRHDWHTGGYVQRLQDEFQVICVDLRGHGESDKPTDRVSGFSLPISASLSSLSNS